MSRSLLLLLILTVASALGVVATQHRTRTLVTAVEREEARGRALEVEWGQLELESSTWAAHARIERVARERLGMVTPDKEALLVVQAPTEAPTPLVTR